MSNTTDPTDPPKASVRTRVRRAAPPPPPAATEPDYPVGYGKPPVHSRFRPGPDARRHKGRRKGAKNATTSIIAMMHSPTSVRTPDGSVATISTAEAMLRKLREMSLTGDMKALAKALDLYSKALPGSDEEKDSKGSKGEMAVDRSETDEAILAWYAQEVLEKSISQSGEESSDENAD
jgi:hypothetical protein